MPAGDLGTRRPGPASPDRAGSLYDALLDEYEPGARTRRAGHPVPGPAGRAGAAGPGDRRGRGQEGQGRGESRVGRGVRRTAILERSYPLDRQRVFGEAVAAAVGFDFRARPARRHGPPVLHRDRAGRLPDHDPLRRHQFSDAFFGILHEVGHGLYDQGLPAEHFGTPMGEARLAGHPRVAVAALGERRRPQPAVLELLVPAGPADLPRGPPRRLARRVPAAVNHVEPEPDPGPGRRGDVQPAHHHPLRAGAGPARPATCRRPTCPAPGTRSTARLLGLTPAERRARAASRTSTGAPGWSATSRPTRWATSTPPSSSPGPRADLAGLDESVRPGRLRRAPGLAARQRPSPRPALPTRRADRACHRIAARSPPPGRGSEAQVRRALRGLIPEGREACWSSHSRELQAHAMGRGRCSDISRPDAHEMLFAPLEMLKVLRPARKAPACS